MASDGDELRLDDLTEIYRVEKKSGSLMTVRPDLYKAIAVLLKKQREEYDKLLSDDPDSLWLEGANARRKKAVTTSKEIVEMRMAKICKMALRGAMGAVNSFESLTPEEKEYYNHVLTASKSHKSIIDHLSGKVRYVNAEITAQPPAPPKTDIPIPEEATEDYYEPGDGIPVPEEDIAVPSVPAEEIIESGTAPLEAIPEAGEFDLGEPDMERDIPDDGFDKLGHMDDPVKEQTVSDGQKDADSDFVIVRVLQDVDTFAGLGGMNYTLGRENVVRLPSIFANILINGKMAVKITPSP